MPKRAFFYIFVVLIIGCALGLVVGNILFKKAVKPTVISKPSVEVPEEPSLPQEAPLATSPQITEEKVTLAPAEIPPAGEEKAPVPVTSGMPVVEKERITKFEFQKGMIYVAWTESGYGNPSSVQAIEQMASYGIGWVGLVPIWYQEKYNSAKIYPLNDKSPSDESLIFAIRKLHELKFKIMLKPHLDLVNADGKWRGEIGFDNPSDWQAWFDSYTDFILHYANIATQENVELLCIGTELANASLTQPQAWRDLIAKIRQVYKSQLTYAANWSNEFDQITFWDALDYAGIDPYFPLICSAKPKVEELKSVWKDLVAQIETWQAKINKPILFTEIGYKSVAVANEEPWQHSAAGELDLELQVNCYKALLETFWDKPWFYGVYWWYWGVNPKMGGELNRGFTPQNKPAQEVVKEWYSKPLSEKSY